MKRPALSFDEARALIWPRIVTDGLAMEGIREKLSLAPICPKCGLKTSWKMRDEYGMCGRCRDVWSAPSRYELAQEIVDSSEEVQVFIAYMLGEKPAARLTTELNQKFPLGEHREWDPFLIWTVDELRRSGRNESVARRLRALLSAKRSSKALTQFLGRTRKAAA